MCMLYCVLAEDTYFIVFSKERDCQQEKFLIQFLKHANRLLWTFRGTFINSVSQRKRTFIQLKLLTD